MDRVTCKICLSRYERASERKTWRNAGNEIYECDVCGNVLEEWTGRSVVPVLQLTWRGQAPKSTAKHPAFRPRTMSLIDNGSLRSRPR
jgi:hypothetical protein